MAACGVLPRKKPALRKLKPVAWVYRIWVPVQHYQLAVPEKTSQVGPIRWAAGGNDAVDARLECKAGWLHARVELNQLEFTLPRGTLLAAFPGGKKVAAVLQPLAARPETSRGNEVQVELELPMGDGDTQKLLLWAPKAAIKIGAKGSTPAAKWTRATGTAVRFKRAGACGFGLKARPGGRTFLKLPLCRGRTYGRTSEGQA